MSTIIGCPNFDSREFYCPGVVGIPLEYRGNMQLLAEQLQVVRTLIDRPLHLNSGWRSKSHNMLVGGVPSSQHLTCKAADVRCAGMSAHDLLQVFEELITAGNIRQGGLGGYSTFVHYDVRSDTAGKPKKARWRG